MFQACTIYNSWSDGLEQEADTVKLLEQDRLLLCGSGRVEEGPFCSKVTSNQFETSMGLVPKKVKSARA